MSKRMILIGLLAGLGIPSAGLSQVCSGDADCDDGNSCTDDICIIIPFPGGFCGFLPNTEPCDDLNVCTSSDVCNAGTCAGTPIPDCSCSISLALREYGERDRVLGTFRAYRDAILGSTLEGRGLAALYYQHTREVAEILESSPDLKREAALILLRVAPVAWRAATGQEAVLSTSEAAAIDRLCGAIQDQAGEELAADLQLLRDRLGDKDLPEVFGVKIGFDRRPRR